MILGITALGHDASVAVAEGSEIKFAGHAERYSRIKNDAELNEELMRDALQGERPEMIVWYERPLLKRARYAKAGQWDALWDTPTIKSQLRRYGLSDIEVYTVGHHESHAAAGYFTSPFDDAAILVCDAIGEFETVTIWHGRGNRMRKVWSRSYPHSIGLLYSAFTQRIGFKPNEEEYIMMGMAALGRPIHCDKIREDLIELTSDKTVFRLKQNVHRGIRDWRPELTDVENIAASAQKITEEHILELAKLAKTLTGSENLVMMGGVALNCVANTVVARSGVFGNFWIMPNPGDAGSSLGAIAAVRSFRLNWKTPYLGHNIERPLDQAGVIQNLMDGKAVGIANGRAEFGPRALGNRSLICDPRGPETKVRLNRIKHREEFRPFAPIVMEEHADRYFDMPVRDSSYMQFVATVRDPAAFPAITHYDGTARVQTLNRAQNPVMYGVLEEWYARSGVPMLVNTSLNIKGEPLVNSWEDARRWSNHYGVDVF